MAAIKGWNFESIYWTKIRPHIWNSTWYVIDCHVQNLSSCSSDTNHDNLLLNTTYSRPPSLRYRFRQSDTNHDSLLQNTTCTRPPRLRFPFQVVQTQTHQLIVEYYLHQATTFEISFSGSSETNHYSLL